MRVEKYLLAIDFDLTMTVNDHMSKSWGDRLAQRLKHLSGKYPLEIFILSAANIAHIYQTIVLSGSPQLLLATLDMTMITNEAPDITSIDHSWGETRKKRENMIKKITNTENYQDVSLIVASKKTNYLIRRSNEEDIPHSHVFLLDDNSYNVRFANYHGFKAFQVDNNSKTDNIFKRLRQMEEMMRKNK